MKDKKEGGCERKENGKRPKGIVSRQKWRRRKVEVKQGDGEVTLLKGRGENVKYLKTSINTFAEQYCVCVCVSTRVSGFIYKLLAPLELISP